MAVARKKNVDSSATGGWFRRRRSQRRDSKLSISHDSTNVQEGKQINSYELQVTGVSHPVNKHQTYKTVKNGGISKTPTQGLKQKQPWRRTSNQSKNNLTQSPQDRISSGQEIPIMPRAAETMPAWLLRLCSLQRYTSVLSFLLVVATLIAYGYTVYSQQLWSKLYRNLQELQRNERQLTITNNALKSKIAAEAENKSTGLVSPSPASQLFIDAAPDSKPDTSSTVVNTIPQQNSTPIGY
ncbi:hypothetical protein NIES4071_60330 [Calothrix sp. NIES-4071]|nr:hypothetical protein NIES4071_60330 [Calothrix sp. NIES-4071]BAZ60340.1 hypothetical protein NIES4105_60280 [Calothrix sp. NIES-4105]